MDNQPKRIRDYMNEIMGMEKVADRRAALAKIPAHLQPTIKSLIEHAFHARKYMRHRAQSIARALSAMPRHKRVQEIASLGPALRTEVERAIKHFGIEDVGETWL